MNHYFPLPGKKKTKTENEIRKSLIENSHERNLILEETWERINKDKHMGNG